MNTLQILALSGAIGYLLYLKAQKDKVELPKEIAQKIDESGIDISDNGLNGDKENHHDNSAINFDNGNNNEHKKIHIKPNEQVVFKPLPIPEAIIYHPNIDKFYQKHGYVMENNLRKNHHLNPRIKTFKTY